MREKFISMSRKAGENPPCITEASSETKLTCMPAGWATALRPSPCAHAGTGGTTRLIDNSSATSPERANEVLNRVQQKIQRWVMIVTAAPDIHLAFARASISAWACWVCLLVGVPYPAGCAVCAYTTRCPAANFATNAQVPHHFHLRNHRVMTTSVFPASRRLYESSAKSLRHGQEGDVSTRRLLVWP